MPKLVGVLDLSGSEGSRLSALTQLLQDWNVEVRLQALPARQDNMLRFADEWQARDYAASLLTQEVKTILLLGARVRDIAVDMVYDGSTGACVTLPVGAQDETGPARTLLSLV